LTALAALLCSCGGGSTAGPVPAASDPARLPATTATTAATPPPATATTAPRREAAAAPAGGTPGGTRTATEAHPPATAPAATDAPPAATSTTASPEPAASEPTPSEPAARTIDERADLLLTRRVSPSHYFQQGTVTGTYDGTMEIEARITSRGVLVRFVATLPGGTISGRGVAVAILDSTTWPALRGTAIVTGGSGRFAGIHGRRLRVTGRAKPDASHARVRLAGTVSLD